jgi:hypothetical protein
MERKFQFSLWDLLLATIWLSICGASFAVLQRLEDYHAQGWPDWLLDYMAVSNYILTVSSPFMAVGVLFGRTRIGLMAGGIVVLVLGWLLPGIQ